MKPRAILSNMSKKPTKPQRSGFNYAGYFREARLLHDLTTLPQDKKWQAVPQTKPEPHKVILYLGCNVLRTSHMIHTVTDIFDRLKVDYEAVGGPAHCCGIIHHRNGDFDLADRLASNTVHFLENYRPEQVVMWCPSCIYNYDELFDIPASFETLHVTEFLVDHLDKLNLDQTETERVALHYHSSHPRRQREADAAKTLLQAIPGVEYVEVDSDDRLGQSCSQFSQEEIGMEAWNRIIEGQISRSTESDAGTLATLYHGCQRTICAFEDRFPITVEHYLSVVGRAMGIEHEDTYKKYTLWRDPEKVLAEMGPCMAAHNIKEPEARKIVSNSFPAE